MTEFEFDLTYCVTRRDLEENGWILTSKLASASGRLMGFAGSGERLLFLQIKSECSDLYRRITDSNETLRQHRQSHKC
jgi:hypothetical protein